MKFEVCGVLLAAGSSKRFGTNKLLHKLPHQETILYASAKSLIAAIPNSVAVIQAKDTKVGSILINLGFKVIENENHTQGLGSSVNCAICNTSADAWVIALADMPFVQIKTIKKIVSMLNMGHKIVAPRFNQQRGNPVGITSDYRTELLKLDSDIGAKTILNKHSQHLKLFDTDDFGVIKDIDTLSDIE